MFSFFKKKSPPPVESTAQSSRPSPQRPVTVAPVGDMAAASRVVPAERSTWLRKLSLGLRKTGSALASVFTGTRIDDALYEDLESALLMADTGVKATEFLLSDLKRRVKEARVTEPAAVKALLVQFGLSAEQIETSGRGEREPLVPTADEVAEPRNRRVDISVPLAE